MKHQTRFLNRRHFPSMCAHAYFSYNVVIVFVKRQFSEDVCMGGECGCLPQILQEFLRSCDRESAMNPAVVPSINSANVVSGRSPAETTCPLLTHRPEVRDLLRTGA